MIITVQCLIGDEIGDEGAMAFLEILKMNTTIEELNLSSWKKSLLTTLDIEEFFIDLSAQITILEME